MRPDLDAIHARREKATMPPRFDGDTVGVHENEATLELVVSDVPVLLDYIRELEAERDAATELCGQVQEWYTAYRRRNPEGRVETIPEPTRQLSAEGQLLWDAAHRTPEPPHIWMGGGLEIEYLGPVEACPTCGSTDRAVRDQVASEHYDEGIILCPDAWHGGEIPE